MLPDDLPLEEHIESTILINGLEDAMQIFDYVPENIIRGIATSLLNSLRPESDLDNTEHSA